VRPSVAASCARNVAPIGVEQLPGGAPSRGDVQRAGV